MPRGINLSNQVKQLIIKKYQEGVKQVDIASQLKLNKSVVCKQIKLYQVRGSIESKPKPGRPRKSGAATDKLIRCSLKNLFFTAVDIKKENPHVSISVRTIRRRLSEGKLHARRPAKKPFISKKKIDGLVWILPQNI